MNVKQLKWIFRKALVLIEAYENRSLTEKDCKDIIAYAQKVYDDSKKNEYCRNVILDVVSALNQESAKKGGEAGNGKGNERV